MRARIPQQRAGAESPALIDPDQMAGSQPSARGRMRMPRLDRRAGIAIFALIVIGVLAAAISSLDLGKVSHALVSARLGWLAAALAVMMSSLLARSGSGLEVARAAL